MIAHRGLGRGCPVYKDRDEYLDDFHDDDADLTPEMVQSIAEMLWEHEDYEGLPRKLCDGLLFELSELAREGAE